MTRTEIREVSMAVYDRAMRHGGHITPADRLELFTAEEHAHTFDDSFFYNPSNGRYYMKYTYREEDSDDDTI